MDTPNNPRTHQDIKKPTASFHSHPSRPQLTIHKQAAASINQSINQKSQKESLSQNPLSIPNPEKNPTPKNPPFPSRGKMNIEKNCRPPSSTKKNRKSETSQKKHASRANK